VSHLHDTQSRYGSTVVVYGGARPARVPGRKAGKRKKMFRLIATVKRGVASDLDEVSTPYSTLDEAREAALSLSRFDVVTSVMITRDDAFVEWAVY
jgi:hypothetical protein